MSASVEFGLVLALLTALGSVVGFLYKFKGARQAPEVQLSRPIHSTIELFRSPVYALGILIALISWGFHDGALALAPISLVQSVIAGGLVLLTVAADKLFGLPVTRREWIGVGLTALGLAFLAATMSGDTSSAHSHYQPGTLAIFLSVVGVAGLLCGLRVKRAAWLAVSAGLLWATSDTSIKALSSHLSALGIGVLIHPLAVVILVASLVGLLISARSLQLGDAVGMIALTSAAANLTTIAAGPIVFGEPWPADTLGQTVRILAFVLVVVAASLTPPPQAPPPEETGAPVETMPGLPADAGDHLAADPR
jgi:hypothetical protein